MSFFQAFWYEYNFESTMPIARCYPFSAEMILFNYSLDSCLFNDTIPIISEGTFEKLVLAQDGTWGLTYTCNNSEVVTMPITCQSNHEWLVAENTTCPAISKNFTSQYTYEFTLYIFI